jgi:poly(3-hydroxybutyrate) depolymerase
MLIYFFSGIFATIGPVAGTPLIGFGELPATPVSLIDFHGTADKIVPFSLQTALGKLF